MRKTLALLAFVALASCASNQHERMVVPFDEVPTGSFGEPIYRTAPTYPLSVAREEITGYVTLTYSIDEDGKTTDIEVVESKPVGAFEKSAIRAIKQWKYKPTVIDGQPVFVTGVKNRMKFRLSPNIFEEYGK